MATLVGWSAREMDVLLWIQKAPCWLLEALRDVRIGWSGSNQGEKGGEIRRSRAPTDTWHWSHPRYHNVDETVPQSWTEVNILRDLTIFSSIWPLLLELHLKYFFSLLFLCTVSVKWTHWTSVHSPISANIAYSCWASTLRPALAERYILAFLNWSTWLDLLWLSGHDL